jgi:ribosomal RNA-processing protein 9
MIDEMAYVETLFGHQDEIPAVVGMLGERCVSVGARDRTARLWKVVEESQLVFRGGGSGATGSKSRENATIGDTGRYEEGSIDCVALVDEQTFVTGSDNGSLSLWSIQRKKPVFTVPLAHGLDPPPTSEESFGEGQTETTKPVSPPKPRWITALTSVPYADVVISGSWDGFVRAWKISEDKREIEAMGIVGRVEDEGDCTAENDSGEGRKMVRGFVNDLACFERGKRGGDGLCIVAAVSKEHRLGRWKKLPGKNGVVVFEVNKKDLARMNSAIPNGAADSPKVLV